MPKQGKPDSFWTGVMMLFAQGKYKFSTGQRPGSRRWKAVLERIKNCPLTPAYGLTVRKKDIFGKNIPCKCGYHDSGQHTGTAAGPQQTGTAAGPQQTGTAAGPQQTGTAAGPQQTGTAAGPQQTGTSGNTMTCSLCAQEVLSDQFTQHLSDFHVQEECEHCGTKAMGAVRLSEHLEKCHVLTSPSAHPSTTPAQEMTPTPIVSPRDAPATVCLTAQETTPTICLQVAPAPTPPTLSEMAPATQSGTPLPSSPASAPPPAAPGLPVPLRFPEVSRARFLPKPFLRVIKPGDLEWIAHILYDARGQLKQNVRENWHHPPSPIRSVAPPNPHDYFRQRMFLWAPMRMWGIPLKCNQCNRKMHHSGIYTKVREVIDVDSKYYLIGGDYPRCSQCKLPVCPWSSDILKQLDPSNRNKFPAVLTTHLALDRKCVTLLRPRTAGNSSSYLQQAFQEAHSEEWARRSCDYFTDCEIHKRSCLKQSQAVYSPPPPFIPLPLAQWFETVHANDVVGHLDELKGVITSTFGRILKLDSTKKVTKKLAGGIENTATWMTNVGNEYGQVLNSVLTTGEGAGLDDLCQGIVQRYRDAGEPQPAAIYVDRDCCSDRGVSPVLHWFRPWTSTVRLDVFHFMRRFTKGLITEHHPLYGTFCSKLSSCIFEWDYQDISNLKEAKRSELRQKHQGYEPTDAQVLASISPKELAKHCRRKTRGVEETRALIKSLLDSMWNLVDGTGLHLINHERMSEVWKVQQKHLACIQDPPGVQLYTNIGSGLEKGDKTLDVLRCARGSSSLESFHKHQCAFIPGWRCNALHTQMYMLEGVSRWNLNRSAQALSMTETSRTKLYDIRLMSNVNALSNKVLGKPLLPEFIPPGKPTGERIAVEYLLAQSNRGDLLSQQTGNADILPEILDEDLEDECPDVTVPQAHDLTLQQFGSGGQRPRPDPRSPLEEGDASAGPVHYPLEEGGASAGPVYSSLEKGDASAGQVYSPLDEGDASAGPVYSPLEEGDASAGPVCSPFEERDASASPVHSPIESDASTRTVLAPFEESGFVTPAPDTRCDARGIPGWEAVDALAGYLVGLNRTITALSNAEVAEILRLYSHLSAFDKTPTSYSLKSKKQNLSGPWRASRKRSGSAPGQQAAERLFMVHGQAAHRPDKNRISECVALKLYKEYKQPRNRPKDNKGRRFAIPQSIVMTYSHIKQLVEYCKEIMNRTDLVLVNINNTTVSDWLQDCSKTSEKGSLLQGVRLPRQIAVAKESLLEVRDLPSQPVQHGHTPLEFQEPENREGEAKIRRRNSSRTPAIPHSGGEEASIAQHDAASSQNISTEGWSSANQPSPTQYQSWSSYQAPLAHSHVWSSTHPQPSASSQGWSATQPPPSASTQGWSAPHPQASASIQGWSTTNPPPSASSQGWPATQPPQSASSQGWSATYPPPSASTQGWSSNQGLSATHPPPSALTQGWSSNQDWSATHPPPSTSTQGWPANEPPPSALSQGWPATEPTPSASSQGWPATQPPPSASSQGWPATQPPPSASSQGWPATQPPPSASSQGWPATQPPPSASSQGWPATQPPPSASSQGWPATQPPPSTSTQGWSSTSFCPDQPRLPHQALDPFNRQREWRLRRAELENQERVRKGEPPKVRKAKESYHYECKLCGQPKSKQTGHSQVRGKWYCPASGQTLEEWRSSL
ncbi:uncharacterized protein [Misgurnus anguillicaudatus]|uniref:uncharacterized protein n=1 Tax=Misgurnus anguillicaudatus TaxID=75329 RepID=UPI003CCFDA4C